MIHEHADLFFRSGSSDKEYQVYLEEVSPGQYRTHSRFGRRGNTNQTAQQYPKGGNGTSNPTTGGSLAAAKNAFDAIVSEKRGKGYQGTVTAYQPNPANAAVTPIPTITPVSTPQGQISGHVPHLLQPIDETEGQALLTGNTYWMQQKMDGDRIAIRTEQGGPKGINRRGLFKPLPPEVETVVLTLGHGHLIDGEIIGATFHAFDLPEHDGSDIRHLSYQERLARLESLIGAGSESLKVVATARTPEEKAYFFTVLQQANVEGVVFKDPRTVYENGGRNQSQKKWKFWKSATVMVLEVNAKRSVKMAIFDPDSAQPDFPIEIGNCSIPPNKAVPEVGSLIEVKYLYAYPGGDLIQPQYQGVRDDLTDEACVISQLIYKAGEEA
jgi:bifunctional non-homologous end joining protein LigD